MRARRLRSQPPRFAWRLIAGGLAILLGALLADERTATQSIAPRDWPQLGRDAGRSGYTPNQVDPPFCYAWKWYGAPIASRTQPVVSAGRLFVGAMDGVLYAIDATSGAPLWRVATGGPIRASAAVTDSIVIVGSHDGFTYGLAAPDGRQVWKTATGPSATAPLVSPSGARAIVASTTGLVSALDPASGRLVWQQSLGAPILTSPALTADGAVIVLGTEAIEATGLDATTGSVRWRTRLQGQSLTDRAPLVVGTTAVFRSQPLEYFHDLLHEGDTVMDRAGAVVADWNADWSLVRPRILEHLSANPSRQTMFVLDAVSGAPRGLVPMLYTYGNNDVPAVPVARGTELFVPYRARHGIQTDGSSVHVTTRYDAELARLDLASLDLAGLRQAGTAFRTEFRLTSDEPAALTMGGNLLLVDNWERLGGLDVSTGALVHVGHVSNDWPECWVQCGPTAPNPFFPMDGQGPAYPFPSPRVTEGLQRAGAVIANDMIYWKVIQAGLAGISHRSGESCPVPRVWTAEAFPAPARPTLRVLSTQATRDPASYLTLDLTTPVAAPAPDLVERLRGEVRDLTSAGGHLSPFYVERGFSTPYLWPYRTSNPPGPPSASHRGHGNVYWHDPGELLYTLAAAYPYLDAGLQQEVRTYVAGALQRYPPLSALPYAGLPWLRTGVPREPYQVPFRQALDSWPPPGVALQTLYGLWLWSKNVGDWSYAGQVWPQARALLAAHPEPAYYADIAGVIGYVRLAAALGDASAEATGRQVAVEFMRAGLQFDAFRLRAEQQYLDARQQATGWYVPVLFGLTPEVGLYLREQIGAPAVMYLRTRQTGNGLRWWYLTRAGTHAEIGETSYVAPIAGWAHFLGQAYLLGAPQAELRRWLDRRWARGDLYSIQKVVATIHATP
jgi:outer membrane protein assembly factor BamB